MKESKFTQFKNWIKDSWNSMNDSTKGACIGSFAGAAITSIISAVIIHKRENAMLNIQDELCASERKLGYQCGIKDGQAKAYFELLTAPEKAFKRMGFDDKDVVKF